ncbi:MAG: efflux RND transporter permease subunit [Chloroflexi bacterium]|nr:MAG: efflux RND transporter permease subunit [Chloroflexota bacterium]
MLSSLFDRITRLSLRYRWVTLAIAAIVLVVGAWSMTHLNLELLPRIEFPQTVVVAQWSGAETAEEFAQAVTIPLEEKLQAIDGVVNVESTTNSGFAFIIVRNDFGLDQDAMVAAIEAAVAETDLPDDMETPQIVNFSLSDLPVVVASVSSAELSLPELKALVQEELQPQLAELEEVSQVTVSGGQELPEEVVAEGGDNEVAETETAVSEPTPEPTPEPTATAEPGRLPDILVQQAQDAGLEIENVQDITVELLQELAQSGDPEVAAQKVMALLRLIPPDLLPFAQPETLAFLPSEYISLLDPTLVAELNTLAADYGGVGQYTIVEAITVLRGEDAAGEEVAEESPTPEEATVELPVMEPVELPESWVAGSAAMGLELTTTADLTPEIMQGVVQFAPQLLAELTPEMWRAIVPEAVAVALPAVADMLEPELLAQLQAIQLAASGTAPEPVPLPSSWIAAASYAGLTIETTVDISADAMTLIAGSTPELLDALTPEILLAFTPDVQAALPPEYVATLDDGLQQTLTAIQVANARFVAQAETGAGGEETAETPAADPARLPDLLVQGAKAAGLDIEFASDITPELVQLLSGFGPQGIQFLSMLTPDNLRALPPESIAWLPAEFLDTLDAELRAELDGLAAEFGGAGQLALQAAAAEETEAEADTSPALSGIWLEPGPNGEPPLFQTADDLLNNPFGVGAADLLNRLPSSPNVADPVPWFAALSPEVLQYLAENEEGFVANLSPVVLEMLSPEALTFLLDTYPDAFAPEEVERLRGIAAGEIEVFVPEASITRTDGNPSVIVNVFKDGDANTVEVAHRVFDALEAFKEEHPEIETNLVFEQATFIEDSIEGVSREGALGAVFAVIVVLLFLSGHVGGKYRLSWRATLVTAVSIPLSVFTAFLLMRWLPPTLGVWLHSVSESSNNGILTFITRLFPTNVTLNIMTLSGMTVAIGRVVDDSIVVLENAYRYIQQGDDPKHAIIEGTREVAIAIFSATATTVAVFLPLGLIGGIIGSFFLPFGLTVTYALAASFVVSITVVPALMYLFVRREHLPEERETTMQRWYTPILEGALRHRALTLVIALAIFLGSLFLLGQLPRSFIPALGEPTVNVTVNLPQDTLMAETDALVRELETAVSQMPGVETIQVEVGSAGGFEAFFGGGGINQNQANITITVDDQDGIEELTRQVRQEAERIFGPDHVRVSAAAQSGFSGFSLIVTGDSLETLQEIAPDVKAAIAAVDVDEDGVPDIANVTSNLDTATTTGDGVIIRIDGRPAISFNGELETENTLGVTNAAKEAVQNLPLPAGVEVTEGFDSQQQVEGFRSMVTAIGYSILIVYLIMALTFRSLIHPFTILFSLPFALVGASIALYITNSVLGISAMVGFMMLVGIVVTNGIVLMELVQQLRKRGRNAYDALVQGGRTRLRPIWMTALAAILALIPLAVSGEAGAIIASELARAVMGGLLVSTALTLIVVPVVYSLIDDFGQWLSKRLSRNRVK